jgi:hypothetical protein
MPPHHGRKTCNTTATMPLRRDQQLLQCISDAEHLHICSNPRKTIDTLPAIAVQSMVGAAGITARGLQAPWARQRPQNMEQRNHAGIALRNSQRRQYTRSWQWQVFTVLPKSRLHRSAARTSKPPNSSVLNAHKNPCGGAARRQALQ